MNIGRPVRICIIGYIIIISSVNLNSAFLVENCAILLLSLSLLIMQFIFPFRYSDIADFHLIVFQYDIYIYVHIYGLTGVLSWGRGEGGGGCGTIGEGKEELGKVWNIQYVQCCLSACRLFKYIVFETE